MNNVIRLLLTVGLVLNLSACQVFSPGKKKKEDTPEKTETSSSTEVGPNTTDQSEATTTGVRSSMTRMEQNMIDEINSLRTDPQGYIVYVKSYMAEVRNNANLPLLFKQQELDAAREVISELSRMRPLPALKSHMGLFEVAGKHIQDLVNRGELNHVGMDGSNPWDRVIRSTDLSDGNENLVGGGRTVRESVIILLVDSGVSGRGHRLNLMNPEWEYLACHHVDRIGDIENCWIQVFGGKSKVKNEVENTTNPTEVADVTSETIPQPYESVNRDINPAPIRRTNNTTGASTVDGEEEVDSAPVEIEDFSFMNREEREMIREINLMRSNPRGYVPYIRKYLDDFKQAGWDAATVSDEVSTGNELIKELEQLSPLSFLKPHKDLHRVAVNHGLDLQQMGKIQHVGSNGSQPWERVRAGTSLTDGNENLVGGLNTARESLINLLIDAGIPNRGHRKTLLEPRWQYVACSKAGNIGEMPNCWVQVFGRK